MKEENNKDKYNYKTVNLRPQQEAFVDCILQGKSYYESYITAYPKSKKWTRNAVQVAANHMMENERIKAKLEEYGWKDKTEVLITRKKMLKRIDKVMQKHEEEMERIQQAYEKDKIKVMAELSEWMKLLNLEGVDREGVQAHINELTQKLIDMDKIRTLNSVNTNGILKSADRINRMMGFDITKVEISQEDEEREEIEKLDTDKLEVLASAILNNRKSNRNSTE